MKKILLSILSIAIVIAMAGCGSDSGTSKVDEKDIVDLTALSSTMVYSKVYEMVTNPEQYEGKYVKMEGILNVYQSPDKVYPACVVQDATQCCGEGIEFVWKGSHKYPDDYPEEGAEIAVEGTFETYMEGENMYIHLADAEMTVK